jgi:hypothetical protein
MSTDTRQISSELPLEEMERAEQKKLLVLLSRRITETLTRLLPPPAYRHARRDSERPEHVSVGRSVSCGLAWGIVAEVVLPRDADHAEVRVTGVSPLRTAFAFGCPLLGAIVAVVLGLRRWGSEMHEFAFTALLVGGGIAGALARFFVDRRMHEFLTPAPLAESADSSRGSTRRSLPLVEAALDSTSREPTEVREVRSAWRRPPRASPAAGQGGSSLAEAPLPRRPHPPEADRPPGIARRVGPDGDSRTYHDIVIW